MMMMQKFLYSESRGRVHMPPLHLPSGAHEHSTTTDMAL